MLSWISGKIQTCFAPAVAVVSLSGCSNKHLLPLGFALHLEPDFAGLRPDPPGLGPDPGQDVGSEHLWKPCVDFRVQLCLEE